MLIILNEIAKTEYMLDETDSWYYLEYLVSS